MPIPAVAAFATPTSCEKRKKSYRERNRAKRCTRALFVKSNLNEDTIEARLGVDDKNVMGCV